MEAGIQLLVKCFLVRKYFKDLQLTPSGQWAHLAIGLAEGSAYGTSTVSAWQPEPCVLNNMLMEILVIIVLLLLILPLKYCNINNR